MQNNHPYFQHREDRKYVTKKAEQAAENFFTFTRPSLCLMRNSSVRIGEMILIFLDQDTIVFVESPLSRK